MDLLAFVGKISMLIKLFFASSWLYDSNATKIISEGWTSIYI